LGIRDWGLGIGGTHFYFELFWFFILSLHLFDNNPQSKPKTLYL